MTRTLARLVLGLGLCAGLVATSHPLAAQSTDATASADGVSMGVPDGIPDRATHDCARTIETAGINNPTSKTMIPMTTSISISVKPRRH